jgi:hypothetical protein
MMGFTSHTIGPADISFVAGEHRTQPLEGIRAHTWRHVGSNIIIVLVD